MNGFTNLRKLSPGDSPSQISHIGQYSWIMSGRLRNNRKLKLNTRWPPDPKHPIDKLVLACIRRANLDVFWSRADVMVMGHRHHIEEGLNIAAFAQIDPPYVPVGPLMASFDHCGYDRDVFSLLKSIKQGWYHTSHR
jgi:hypothetical protein